MPAPPKRVAPPPRLRAFTFVEVLIVIAIVVAILGILLVIGANMKRNAKRQSVLVTFSHMKDAFVVYRSTMGYAVDENESAGWMVSEGGGPLRPLSTMEYFLFRMRMASEANKPILMIDPALRLPSTAKAGAFYVPVRIFVPLQDAAGNPVLDAQGGYTYDTNAPVYTLYDPAAPLGSANGAPVGTAFSESNRGPLYTVVGPWDPDAWDPSDWSHTGTGATGKVFKWRPHEMDFRRSTAVMDDPATPVNELETKVSPYLPLVEAPLFSSPGPDGLWGALGGHDPAQPDAEAKDNVYSHMAEN